MDIGKEEITAFSYELDGETLSFYKEDDNWVYEGDTSIDIDEDQIESILSYITTLTAESSFQAELMMAEYGFENPANTIVLETKEQEIILYLGDRNSMVSGYYLKLEGDDTIYLITTGITSRFSKSVEDLTVEVEETETVETTEVIETTETIETESVEATESVE